MKKLLRYSFLMLIALISGNMNAGTIDFSTLGLENGVQYLDPFDGGDFTVTFAGGANDGKYYNTGTGIRVYGGGTMSIAAKSGSITKLVITYDGSNKPTDGTVVDGGTYDAETGVWTGSASSVIFTRPSGSGHWRVQKIEATVEGGSTVTIAAPSISGTTPFVGSTEVTITNNEEGAKVYYTTNGDAPTASSQEYAAPFRVTETTTVKAIAVKGSDVSSIVSKKFVARTSVSTIAEMNALADKTPLIFTGQVLVVAIPNSSNCYIKDDTGVSLLYGNNKFTQLEKGKKASQWLGTVSMYNGLFEVAPDEELKPASDDIVEVTYETVEIADMVAANVNKVVTLKGVTAYTAFKKSGNDRAFTITKGDATIAGWNAFGLEDTEASAEGKTYDIVGAISINNDVIRFQPISIAEAAPDTWTVAGTLPLVDKEWDPTDTSADMTPNGNGEGVSSYEKDNIVLEKGTSYEFKVVKNHSWNEAYPAQNYSFTVDETGIYHVKIFFNTTTHEISVEKTKTGEAGPVTHTYSVIGNFKDDWKTDFDMTKGEDGLYKAVIEDVAKGEYKFKVRVDKAWTTSYPASDYQLTVDADNSTVTVTFNEETKEVNATVQASSGITAVMAAQQNGAIYNLAGQKVGADYKGLVIKNGRKYIQK